MEGFDIFIMVLAFFAMIVITVSKSKRQQARKTGHPTRPTPTPSHPARGSSQVDVLEEVKRALVEAERDSSQSEQGLETYLEHESAMVEQVKVGAGEGIRSTVAVKDEKYSFEKNQKEAAKGVKVNIDPRNLIIYSEIMRPKWEEY